MKRQCHFAARIAFLLLGAVAFPLPAHAEDQLLPLMARVIEHGEAVAQTSSACGDRTFLAQNQSYCSNLASILYQTGSLSKSLGYLGTIRQLVPYLSHPEGLAIAERRFAAERAATLHIARGYVETIYKMLEHSTDGRLSVHLSRTAILFADASRALSELGLR